MDSYVSSILLKKRYLVAFLSFLGFVNFQMLRNNINITILEMTSNKSVVVGNTTMSEPADFNWNSFTIGVVLSVIAYGGLFAFIGGFLADWLGGAVSCGLFTLIGGMLTLLHPLTLNLNFSLFLVCRFFTGMFESFYYASFGSVLVQWFPENERSTMGAFSFSGVNVGVSLTYPVCGYIAYTWGWQAVFYTTGVMSVLMGLLYGVIVRNTPSEDKWISKEELKLILDNRNDTDQNTKVIHPFKSILKSMPLWSLCTAMFSYMWLSTVSGTCFPLYAKDVTQKNTKEIGLISAIPNVVFIFSVPLSNTIMNYWRDHSTIPLTRIYKIMMVFACVSSTISFILIILLSNFVLSVVLFTSIQIESSFMIAIIEIVPVNLCPASSSFLYGILVIFFSLGTIISQSVTSSILQNHAIYGWNLCFISTSFVLIISAIIFAIYGSNELQPWCSPPVRTNESNGTTQKFRNEESL